MPSAWHGRGAALCAPLARLSVCGGGRRARRQRGGGATAARLPSRRAQRPSGRGWRWRQAPLPLPLPPTAQRWGRSRAAGRGSPLGRETLAALKSLGKLSHRRRRHRCSCRSSSMGPRHRCRRAHRCRNHSRHASTTSEAGVATWLHFCVLCGCISVCCVPGLPACVAAACLPACRRT